jgi:hypothetical protein
MRHRRYFTNNATAVCFFSFIAGFSTCAAVVIMLVRPYIKQALYNPFLP